MSGIIGQRRSFKYRTIAHQPGVPTTREVERAGVGVIVDVGTDHDGYCLDESWCRLRVESGDAAGEIVLVRTFNTALA